MRELASRLSLVARALALVALISVGLPGCEKGPAEKVGEKIDDATGRRSGAEKAADKLEDAGKNVKDAAKDVGKDTKRKVNDATR